MKAGRVQRRTSREALLSMPDVFSLAELALVMDCARRQASQYVWRWQSRRLVLPLGGRSGVFLNLVRNPAASADGLIWERAVLKAMPSAMAAGFEVLAESGLTTQVTHQRYLIVSNFDAAYEVGGAEVHRRPVPWMNRLVREGAVIAEARGEVIPRLRPGAALADLVRFALSVPQPDDIDLEAVGPDELSLFRKLAKGTDLLAALEARAAR